MCRKKSRKRTGVFLRADFCPDRNNSVASSDPPIASRPTVTPRRELGPINEFRLATRCRANLAKSSTASIIPRQPSFSLSHHPPFGVVKLSGQDLAESLVAEEDAPFAGASVRISGSLHCARSLAPARLALVFVFVPPPRRPLQPFSRFRTKDSIKARL